MKSGSLYSYCSDEEDEIDWELEIIGKRYIILNQLGEGAYASVWLAYDIYDLKYYAIKISNCDDYKVCKKETNTYDTIKNFDCQ